MKRLLNFYKANDSVSNMSRSLEIVFDFVIVATASLILTGFVVNNETTDFKQMLFMLINASVLSTHWFAHTVFKQRYEKKRTFFRINTMAQVMALGLLAVGISLLAFERSGWVHSAGGYDQQTYKDLPYLELRGLLLWLIGYLASRAIVAFNFFMAWKANKENRALVSLTMWKAISRGITVVLAIVHLVLMMTMPNQKWLFIYIFLPIYFVLEFTGNFIGVTDKNLSSASAISYEYMKERYSKLLILYISSMFVSGTVQFAFYLKHIGDDYMIARFVMTYIIAFMMWWLHSDRLHRFTIKSNTKHLHILSLITVILSPALAIFGGALINANTNDNLKFIIPALFFAFALILVMYLFVVKIFENKTKTEVLTHKTKMTMVYQIIPFAVISLALGILSLFFSFTIWVPYGVIIASLVALAVMSRWIIHYKIKSCE